MRESANLSAQTSFSASRRPTALANHSPGYIYTSPEIFQREKEEIFLKDWLCVARTDELAEPGDYMTFRIVDEPIIVTRNSAGELAAFANVCKHRGVEVASGHGNTKEFSCPYHGWLYDLDGKLMGAPYMKEASGFNPAACRLDPVRLDTWAGWVQAMQALQGIGVVHPQLLPLNEFEPTSAGSGMTSSDWARSLSWSSTAIGS